MTVQVSCWCVACDEMVRTAHILNGANEATLFMRTFVVCPDCGNKRCPRATHHDHACSGSNDYGQPGSVYGGLA